MCDGVLRQMEHSDLEMVLSWRNAPEVRRYMFTQHRITIEEHRCWYKNALQDKARSLMIFERDCLAQGFVQFGNLNANAIANWGFYIAPDAPRGTGKLLGYSALAYGFQRAFLHKVCGQALDFNKRSIKFHQQLGFQQEGVLREQHFDGKSYHAVICFGLLRSEWEFSNSGASGSEKC